MNALDLFAGAGGMSRGMLDAGIHVIAAVENNPRIAATYHYNHPQTALITGDIREVPARAGTAGQFAPLSGYFAGAPCDLIFGGPPCQGFSMAGRRIRAGAPFLAEPRNLLFLEFIRMVRFLQPAVFVLENVPGILTYNDGSVACEILDTFSALGYAARARVLCAADYGVPQTRRRAVFIGTRLPLDPETLFPPATHPQDGYVTVRAAISDLPALAAGEGAEPTAYDRPPEYPYQTALRSPDGLFYNHISAVHQQRTLEILAMIGPGQTLHDLPETFHTRSVHSGAYGRMVYDEPAYTLTTRLNTPSVGRITHPAADRTITPREAARIQSFPDSYRFLGDITTVGIQIGNAVPPLLAQRIGEQIRRLTGL